MYTKLSSQKFSEQFSDEEFSDEEMADSEESDTEMDKKEMDDAERLAAMDKLVPALEPSEYGKMPPSFSSSQRVASTTIKTDKVETSTAHEKPIRPPILSRDKYEGVDSDDETDEEDQDEESEEEMPQVVGEVEIDMQEEEEEFLEFSRQALGISDDQWNEIIRDRRSRGGEQMKVPKLADIDSVQRSYRPVRRSRRQRLNAPNHLLQLTRK